MTPIDLITIVPAYQAPAGSLLLRNRDVPSMPPQLIFDDTAPQGQTVKWALNLAAGMQAVQVQASQHPSLAIAPWRIEVDPTSVTSPFNSSPAVGEACIYAGQPGFLCKVGYGEAVVLTSGSLVANVDWPEYTGFSDWRIVRDVEGCCDPVLLLARP